MPSRRMPLCCYVDDDVAVDSQRRALLGTHVLYELRLLSS